MKMIKFPDLRQNQDKLWTKDMVIHYLDCHGSNDRTLTDIRSIYAEQFGNELVWYYPFSDGKYMGMVLVAVQEGFLKLPYDIIDAESNEIFGLCDASLLDSDAIKSMKDDFMCYADELWETLDNIQCILSTD